MVAEAGIVGFEPNGILDQDSYAARLSAAIQATLISKP